MAKTPAKRTQAPPPSVIDVSTLAADADHGHGFTREDLALPFVRVLQKLSPQLDKAEPEYIDGAEEGDFLNTATGTVIGKGDTGIVVCPSVYTMNYTEWRPRESGGGIVKDHGIDASCLEKTNREKGRDVTPEGNLIVTSALYYGQLVDTETGAWEQVILAMASTQLKKSRRMNAVIQNFRMTITIDGEQRTLSPRMWYHLFHITTLPESNEHGKWMGLKIERSGCADDHEWGGRLYQEGQMLDKMFQEGKVKTRAEDLGGDETEQGNTGGAAVSGAGGAAEEDEIPF